ncbi:DNA transposition AAA+ family ATPase [Chelatococcus caeni]|uniref:DNA transposition AAA+ family ATPase n=1 Tax=Chelatococcus caeni TaxID=1348468 RepID=A0A840C610_9HYPH|nr:AAA family ATPase [Chelatococcus caeni]MBB4018336.1 DNA transposition AAA+ family ATPase [Chelatococcus caeni]
MSLQIITPMAPDFCAETSVSRRIEDAVEFAIMTNGAVGVRGAPGIGKSATVGKLLASDKWRIVAFEVPAGAGTQRNLVSWACTALDVPSWAGQHVGAVLSRIRERRTCACLIVDEIQNADSAGVRSLLSLNEHGGLPLVLIGNNEALTPQANNAAAWAQIEDRVTKIVELEASLASDIEAIARAWAVSGSDALEVVVAYGENRSLRKVIQLLRAASAMVEWKEPLTIDHLKRALQYIGAPVSHLSR